MAAQIFGRQPYIGFLLPAALLVCGLFLVPVGQLIILSFDGFTEPSLRYYEQILATDSIKRILWTTFRVVSVTTLIAVVLVLAVFPSLLDGLADLINIYSPPNLLFMLAIGFLLLVCIYFSWELSRLEDRTRTLAEEVALLKAERELDS